MGHPEFASVGIANTGYNTGKLHYNTFNTSGNMGKITSRVWGGWREPDPPWQLLSHLEPRGANLCLSREPLAFFPHWMMSP